MVRKLALVMAMTAAGLPNWANALGLGDIDLNSYLNQPLEAEIPLRASSGDELDSVRVSLASRADFARAGIDYQNSLRQLKFDVVLEGDSPIIKITSNGDFREPYVSFLLEVNWSRGRIMREYTLLVDPPVIAGEGGAAVSAPRTSAPAQASTEGTVSVPQRRSVAAQPRGLPAATRNGDTYGPTQRTDTMWTIASELRPDESVSVEQTMLALQRLNPDAFINGNVNQLKAGYVLKVPSREEIAAMTQAQARSEFRRQTEAWRRGEPVATATADAGAAATGPQGRLQLLAPDAEQGAGEGSAAQQGDEGVGTGEPGVGSAAGSAAGTSEQSGATQERVAQLQQQVKDLERLAKLKDDQLAALQAQLQALREQTGAAAPAPETMAPSADAGEAPMTEAPAAEAPMAEAPGMEEQAPDEMAPMTEQPTDTQAAPAGRFGEPVEATRASPGQANNPYAVEGYNAVDLNNLPSGTLAQPAAEQAGAAAGADAAAQQPKSIGDQVAGWWHKTVALFQNNPLYLGIAIAVLIVLLLAIMAVRQRRRAASNFGESILQPAPEPRPEPGMAAAAAAGAAAVAAAPEPAVAAEEEAPRSEEAESSYLSDFSISSMDSAIESEVSEADPLTEADVFLAYGRYQPAENMIKEAIESEPDRLDLKIKLLEIYYAARNADAFEREAQVVHGLVEDHSDPAWQKVVEMGRDLCPASPLFEDGGAEAAAAAPADDMDLSDMEFDLPEDETLSPSAEGNAIDFDLGELEERSQPHAESAAQAATGVVGSAGMDDQFAFSGELEEDSQASEATPPESEVADFDLSDLSLEPEGEPDYLANMDEEPEEDAEVVDGGLLSDGDEVGTKLDLARAYIDMGDPDGARSILDEVLEEGSEDQKNEAQGLMAQIS